MGLYSELNVITDLDFLSNTPTLHLPIDYTPALQAIGDQFLTTAHALCPVDTGLLVSSITVEITSPYSCIFMTDVEYAEYVEYGTLRQEPQPYFEPALQDAMASARISLQEIQNEAIMEEAKQLQNVNGGGGAYVPPVYIL